jgi:lipopolysaccharide cholinephosphotransferase
MNIDLLGIQKIETDILKEFDRVCQICGINYCLWGGSLLGAVRHQGFIPWDDDIDVAVNVNDFEKLIKEWEKNSSNSFFLQTVYTDNGYLLPYGKIRINNTAWVEYPVSKLNQHQGIFIDVFPLIHIPKKSGAMSLLRLKRNLYDFQVSKGFLRRPNQKIKHFALKRAASSFFTCFSSPKKAALKMALFLKRVDKKYQNSEYVDDPYFDHHYFKKDFDFTKRVKFGTIMANIPLGYDRALTIAYGNYMKLPPMGKRKLHHDLVYFSMNHEYKMTVASNKAR